MKFLIFTRILTVASLGLLAIPTSADEPLMLTPNDLKWKPTPTTPGREQADLVGDSKKEGLYVMRVKLPPNYVQQAHSHPDDRSYTILSGTFYIGWGEKFDETKLKPLSAGSFYIEQGGVPHFVATKDDGTIIQISGKGPSGQNFVDPAHAPKK